MQIETQSKYLSHIIISFSNKPNIHSGSQEACKRLPSTTSKSMDNKKTILALHEWRDVFKALTSAVKKSDLTLY